MWCTSLQLNVKRISCKYCFNCLTFILAGNDLPTHIQSITTTCCITYGTLRIPSPCPAIRRAHVLVQKKTTKKSSLSQLSVITPIDLCHSDDSDDIQSPLNTIQHSSKKKRVKVEYDMTNDEYVSKN